jgi:2-polyprenyl-3-methyl-5-hydroxy-6-metoxy-1,4-benzoquinol methylase
MNGGWYDPPYRRYPFHAGRADFLTSTYPNLLTSRVLIAGCGYGYLVDELASRGWTNVWGCDASAYCLSRAATEVPAVASRIVAGDLLDSASLGAVRSAAGLTGNQRFRLVVTEDVLGCAESSEEIVAMLANVRGIAQATHHFITALPEGVVGDPELWWESQSAWLARVGELDNVTFAGGVL